MVLLLRWAQTRETVSITVKGAAGVVGSPGSAGDGDDHQITLRVASASTPPGPDVDVNLRLHGAVSEVRPPCIVAGGGTLLRLVKKANEEWWPHLLDANTKVDGVAVQTDWTRWVDEDDVVEELHDVVGPGISDPGMSYEDLFGHPFGELESGDQEGYDDEDDDGTVDDEADDEGEVEGDDGEVEGDDGEVEAGEAKGDGDEHEEDGVLVEC